MEYTKEELKEIFAEAIKRKFGGISCLGAYSTSGAWVSTEAFLEMICDTIDENDIG